MEANPKLEDLQNFFSENFNFRYNVLTDMPECKPKNTATYQMIDNVTFEQIKRAAEYLSTALFFYKIGFLLRNNKIVVLLTALNKQVLFIQQICSSDNLVESSELFLVKRNTTTLNELTHFAL